MRRAHRPTVLAMAIWFVAVPTSACLVDFVLPDEVCTDGVDNDGDGRVDCEDSDCAGQAGCQGDSEICDDGIDNDQNFLTDCEDPDCLFDPACADASEICDDGIDNDQNSLVDCDDPDCLFDPACADASEICDDGIDNDDDGLADCDDPWCYPDPICPGPDAELFCGDGGDDDGDGQTDCADPDCAAAGGCSEPGAWTCAQYLECAVYGCGYIGGECAIDYCEPSLCASSRTLVQALAQCSWQKCSEPCAGAGLATACVECIRAECREAFESCERATCP